MPGPVPKPTKFYAFFKPGARDAAGSAALFSIKEDLRLPAKSVRTADAYSVSGIVLSSAERQKLAKFMFSDSVVQDYSIDKPPFSKKDGGWLLEVGFKPGVTDNVGLTSLIGMADVLGRRLPQGTAVRTSIQYCVKGPLSKLQAEKICSGLLANPVIQDYSVKKL